MCRQGYLGSWLRVRRDSCHCTSHGCFEGEHKQRSRGCAVGIHSPGMSRPLLPGPDCSDGSGSFTAPGTVCSATCWNEGQLMYPGTSRRPEGTKLPPAPGEGPGQPARGADRARRRGIARGQGRGRPEHRGCPGRKRGEPGGPGVTAPAPPLRGQIKVRAAGRVIPHRCATPASTSSIPASAPWGPRAMDAGCLRPHSLLLFLGKRRGPRSRGQGLGGHRVLRPGAGAFFGCWEICIKT